MWETSEPEHATTTSNYNKPTVLLTNVSPPLVVKPISHGWKYDGPFTTVIYDSDRVKLSLKLASLSVKWSIVFSKHTSKVSRCQILVICSNSPFTGHTRLWYFHWSECKSVHLYFTRDLCTTNKDKIFASRILPQCASLMYKLHNASFHNMTLYKHHK